MFNRIYNVIQYHVKEYFTFSQSDKKGAMFLLLLIVLLIGAIVVVKFTPSKETDFSAFKREIAMLEKNAQMQIEKNQLAAPISKTEAFNADTSYNENQGLFKFDPNNLPDTLWLKLGLNQKQIAVIKNYEAKGGRFYKKEDLKKIYGITPAFYATVEPFIRIEKSIRENKYFSENKYFNKRETYNSEDKKQQNEIKPIDLNIATEEQLDAIPGIGKFFANGIIKYRNLLGGYCDKKQLLEVYNYSDSLYNVTEKYFFVNKVYINTINVNWNIKKELRHPYITYDMIDRLFVYKKVNGPVTNYDQLKKAMQIDDATLEKIKVYVRFTD